MGKRNIVLVILLLITLVLGLTGCSKNTPEQAIKQYVASWQNQDYAGMYKQLSNESKSKNPEEQFVKRFKDIYGGIALKKLELTPEIPEKIIKDADGKVYIPVKVSMDTLAGPVEFPYQATLVKEKQEGKTGWYIEWNQKSIFSQLDDGDKVRAERVKAKRGEIKDRNGKGLAINGTVASIGVVPGKLQDKNAAKDALAKALGITAEQVDSKLNQSWVQPNYFVPIGNVSAESKGNYASLTSIPGIFIRDENARVYPYKDIAAQLTGYLRVISAEELSKLKSDGYSDTSLLGKSGLEQAYEKRLKGEDGGTIYLEDSSGNKKTTIAQKAVKNGEDIKLTIDIELQQKLYAQLSGEKGTSVATNPKTGEVLALVSSPSFDPNLFILGISDSQWQALNDAEQKPLLSKFAQGYSPGSTFKVITAAIGLKTGKLNPEEKVNITGLQWQKNTTWGNYYVTRMGDPGSPENLTDALVHSDNIYFAQQGLKIGPEVFVQEAKNFGFGEQLPFDLSLQKSQIAGQDAIQGETQLADTGYGQGQILVNPLHLAVIYSGLVNSGNLLKPHLEFNQQPEVWKEKAYTPEAAERIFKDLVQVVEKGTASQPQVPTPMAGKTGTAELKKTIDDKDPKENGWFIAINKDNPRLLILMMIEDVKAKGGSHYVVPKVKMVMNGEFKK